MKDETESKTFLAEHDFDENQEFVELSFTNELESYSDNDLELELQPVDEIGVQIVENIENAEVVEDVDESIENDELNEKNCQKNKTISHSSSNLSEKLLKCELCDKSFEYRASLSNHMRVHKGRF